MTALTQRNTGLMGYWTGCFRRYATFAGRASRAEYWSYTLINIVLLALAFGIGFGIEKAAGTDYPFSGLLLTIYMLAAIVPTYAVTCRRMHDAGLSGWWILLGFIPLGGFVVFIMTVLDSKHGPNQNGPDPRTAG